MATNYFHFRSSFLPRHHTKFWQYHWVWWSLNGTYATTWLSKTTIHAQNTCSSCDSARDNNLSRCRSSTSAIAFSFSRCSCSHRPSIVDNLAFSMSFTAAASCFMAANFSVYSISRCCSCCCICCLISAIASSNRFEYSSSLDFDWWQPLACSVSSAIFSLHNVHQPTSIQYIHHSKHKQVCCNLVRS